MFQHLNVFYNSFNNVFLKQLKKDALMLLTHNGSLGEKETMYLVCLNNGGYGVIFVFVDSVQVIFSHVINGENTADIQGHISRFFTVRSF